LVGNHGQCSHQLCFVDLIINGIEIQALVDSGALHNFLQVELASQLELRVGSCGASIKEVNSKATATTGVASTIHMQLDKWKILWMDEFEVILCQKFPRRMQSVLMPLHDKLVIFGGQKTFLVCTKTRNMDGRVCLVSALSMKRVARHP
jgi:hypothetical protein